MSKHSGDLMMSLSRHKEIVVSSKEVRPVDSHK